MLRVAVVHDWLYTYAGAERVLEQILAIWPQADIFSLIDYLPEERRGFIQDKPVKTSFIQHLPFAKTHHRSYLPLMPMAIEQLNLSGYDLVLTVHYSVANGVITGPDQLMVSYCCSPMRYAWDLQGEYLREMKLDRGIRTLATRMILHYMRLWDVRSSHGVDHFVTLSEFVARRIRKCYQRDSSIIPPPVDTESFAFQPDKQDYYVTASRLVPYKRVDLIVSTFAKHHPDKKLVVVGDGPDMVKIRRLAGPNVSIMGFQSQAELTRVVSNAKAFVFAAQEDFGIAPLEAQATGTPVIALRKGGAAETIRGSSRLGQTGVFFEEQTEESIAAAVAQFEELSGRILPADCRANALGYSVSTFRTKFSQFVQQKLEERFGDR